MKPSNVVPMKSVQKTPDKQLGPTPIERAVYTFFLITLIAPALAAVVIFASSVIAGLVGRGPASLLALDAAGQFKWAAQKALETYVWSAIPAGVAGVVIAATVYLRGTVHWLAGASAGAIVVSIMSVVAGGMMQQHLTPMAFIGALVGAVMIYLLKRIRILV
jgi:hypothetical protein